ncbi:hypothetical protein [Methanobacterium formicicum]|uniref:Uncharacterized protein n=1 Tax=Methanobacterium formicicum (strain DSM 3637 / PP1) TaxID=1204725 RepID=K2RTF8_METFP|nr:hypothetical protein [Methanobacterium formicicum]EKF86080.1 hypothetical protein A994_06331 [Methanobacterium formicicum DSM 3637]
MNLKSEGCLLAYYSCEGDNIVSGKIVNLPICNPEVTAKMIQEITDIHVSSNGAENSYPVDCTEITNGYMNELFLFLKFNQE